jgi:long-chain acyl-CoA synthetase
LSDAARRAIATKVKAGNASLSPHQRVDGWRLWPEPDFPRTHTLKVRRNVVQEWATADASSTGHVAETW